MDSTSRKKLKKQTSSSALAVIDTWDPVTYARIPEKSNGF
jgi:hypothetical protein